MMPAASLTQTLELMDDRGKQALSRALDVIGDEATHMVAHVVYDIYRIFEEAECPKDFCVQNVGHDSITFGGWNRVTWHPGSGIVLHRSSCTQNFIETFERRYKPIINHKPQ